jgi:hypothetical protein
MQRFAVERCNHPVNGYGSDGLLESGDFRPTDSGLSALELNEPEVEHIGFAFRYAEYDRVDDACTWRSCRALEERNTPICSHG